MGLAERIEATWAGADRDAPQPTLTRFRALLDEHPGDVAALYAHACALDPGLRRYQWALQRYAAALTDDDRRHP
ncbi:hypothetical protein ACFPIJ_42670 [Dactylosporangium cerinum]|uniref:Uncharacterized protein n=1 Tax=Dactylosporangium cerinum TaxID=1434730 RepID=A0ABV9WAR4_9ACTN